MAYGFSTKLIFRSGITDISSDWLVCCKSYLSNNNNIEGCFWLR